MKKTISINIAGVIFYIEEDAYEKLKGYLASVQKYFSTYEGSREIVEDIESRIAEKFAEKQKLNANQALNEADVDGLIASMGTVADFEALAEQEDLLPKHSEKIEEKQQDGAAGGAKSESNKGTTTNINGSDVKRIFRDTKRKLLGGVCAGIANYMSVDPLWVRLITLVLFLGLAPLNGLGGTVFILYMALWIAFPGNFFLEEDPKIKKLYRDPDTKVLGGIVGGIGKYTGWDLGVLRLIFVLSIFLFGSGLIIYLILWMITPMAKTLTDKMHMKGEPITLENIETNIKRNINASDKIEGSLTKLLLFPFRAISAIFTAIGPLVRFAGTAARIFGGVLMIIVGVITTFGIVVALLSGLGLMGTLPIVLGDVPVHYFTGDASVGMFVFGFLALVIPFALIAILGIWVVSKHNPLSSIVWQSLLGVWVAGVLGASVTIGRFATNFAKRGSIEKTELLLSPKPILFALKDDDNNDNGVLDTKITLKGYEGTDTKALEEYNARGKSRVDAEKNASSINYKLVQKDSIVVFDRHFELPNSAKYREQQVVINLFIPYEKQFGMTKEFARFVTNSFDYQYFENDLLTGSLWKFTKTGELVCLNRVIEDRDRSEEDLYQDDYNEDEDGQKMGQGAFKQSYQEKGFEAIKLSGAIYTEIKQGVSFKIEIDGKEKDVRDMRVYKQGNTLVIEPKNNFLNWKSRDRINVSIEMPDLKELKMSGATSGIVKGFSSRHDFDIEISGASRATISGLAAAQIEADVTGAGKLTLIGMADMLKADLGGAGKLRAYGLRADNAKVDASGAASVEIKTLKGLTATSTGASNIKYRGGATNNKIETSGAGSVEKDEQEEE
jgi:phage shock protein PspC (stress-responsive transcriptional regulator)